MKIKDFQIFKCRRWDIKDFIEKWHYSKNINGIQSTYCFKMVYNGETIGAMIFSNIAMKNAWKRYADNKEDLMELRRLCCIDDTPKNTESYFIGYCLRWLEKNTSLKKIVSYADPNYEHVGTIYKATNFKYLGVTSKGKMIEYKGKIYHDKIQRVKEKGVLKPIAIEINEALKKGEAIYKKTKGKHIYLYDLKTKFKPKEESIEVSIEGFDINK